MKRLMNLAGVALGAVLMLAACSPSAPSPESRSADTVATAAETLPPHRVRLDHVPIAVANLEAAAAAFQDRLGFTLKPGRLHANTLDNVHLKFADGTALELITVAEPRDTLAATYLRFLEHGDGPAYLALDGGSSDTLAARLRAHAVSFERTDGPYYTWLTFPDSLTLRYLFFNEIHARPADRPEHLVHPNTAEGLVAVWLAAADFTPEYMLLAALGRTPDQGRFPLPGMDLSVPRVALAHGSLYLLPPTFQPAPGRRVVGVTIAVADLDAVRARLGALPVNDHAQGRSLIVPPDQAHGLWLMFLER